MVAERIIQYRIEVYDRTQRKFVLWDTLPVWGLAERERRYLELTCDTIARIVVLEPEEESS